MLHCVQVRVLELDTPIAAKIAFVLGILEIVSVMSFATILMTVVTMCLIYAPLVIISPCLCIDIQYMYCTDIIIASTNLLRVFPSGCTAVSTHSISVLLYSNHYCKCFLFLSCSLMHLNLQRLQVVRTLTNSECRIDITIAPFLSFRKRHLPRLWQPSATHPRQPYRRWPPCSGPSA